MRDALKKYNCKVCCVRKPESSFYGKARGSICRACVIFFNKAVKDKSFERKFKAMSCFARDYFNKNKKKKKPDLKKYCKIKYRKKYEKIKEEAFKVLGEVCARCGEDNRLVLQFDHVFGGGSRERKRLNSVKRCADVLFRPRKYQILCANCNIIKKHENKEI